MATPSWIAATPGQPPLANQVNQFLGTHAIQFVYTGVSLGGQTTAGTGSTATNGLYITQTFTPGTTQAPGRFVLTLARTGSPAPLTVSIQTNSAGAPSGTSVASTSVPSGYVPTGATAVSIPLPCSLTASTVYWIVLNAVGDASNFFSWSKSNQTSGVSTSTNGTSWTTQTYGCLYQRFDQSAVAPLLHTYEDTGARWTTLVSGAGTALAGIDEYTVGQASGYLQSQRTITGYPPASIQ